MQDDRERVRGNVLRSLESVSLLAFPTFFGMAIVAPEAIDLFLGTQWTPAVLPLQILCMDDLFLKGLEKVIVPGTGHFVHVERPDEVNRRIVAFFQAAKGGSP